MTLKTPVAAFAALALAALSTLSLSVQAQKITALQVEPAKAEVGQTVKVITSLDVSNTVNCRVRVHFGDDQTNDFQINQSKDVPLVLEHAYAKPGKYALRVEGKGASKCMGEDQHTTLDIVAKPVAAKKPTTAASAAAASVCPTGWKLTKAGVSKKTGAFMCTAKAKTPIPEPKVVCPGELTYFENVKKGQLGCRV